MYVMQRSCKFHLRCGFIFFKHRCSGTALLRQCRRDVTSGAAPVLVHTRSRQSLAGCSQHADEDATRREACHSRGCKPLAKRHDPTTSGLRRLIQANGPFPERSARKGANSRRTIVVECAEVQLHSRRCCFEFGKGVALWADFETPPRVDHDL